MINREEQSMAWYQWVMAVERVLQESIPFYKYVPYFILYIAVGGIFFIFLEEYLIPEEFIDDLMTSEKENELSSYGRTLRQRSRRLAKDAPSTAAPVEDKDSG